MIPMTRRVALSAAIALTALATGAALAGSGGSGSMARGGLACGLSQTRSGGEIILVPSVQSAKAASGSYDLRVSGGGSGGTSTIRQGGDFSLAAGGSARLGSLSLMARGASYDVTLEVTTPAASARCSTAVSGG
jgi:hypothetical protein